MVFASFRRYFVLYLYYQAHLKFIIMNIKVQITSYAESRSIPKSTKHLVSLIEDHFVDHYMMGLDEFEKSAVEHKNKTFLMARVRYDQKVTLVVFCYLTKIDKKELKTNKQIEAVIDRLTKYK